MLKAVEDAFTIIHIRISGIRFFGISARHFITSGFIVFIIINTIRIFMTARAGDLAEFAEASIFIIITLFSCLAWIISWPKADKMLNKAVRYEEEYHKHKKK